MMSSADPKVAVVVPVHGRLPLTIRFLESFRQVAYRNAVVVLIDDRSPDDTADHLARHFPEVKVLQGDGKLWWAGGTNKGVRYALARRFPYVLTINNDAIVHPDFLGRLVETAEAHPGSIVGSRINFLDDPGKVWAIGGYTNWEVHFILNLFDNDVAEEDVLERRSHPWPAEFLTGCGTLVPTGCYRKIGLYDERMCPQYHADSEFTLRAGSNGYRILVDLRGGLQRRAAHLPLATPAGAALALLLEADARPAPALLPDAAPAQVAVPAVRRDRGGSVVSGAARRRRSAVHPTAKGDAAPQAPPPAAHGVNAFIPRNDLSHRK